MRSIVIRFSALAIVFLLNTSVIWAQATAQISGTVGDQSGAVLPGVEVTATNTDTGISRNTISNETGSYVLPNLAIGPYRVEAALPGFRTYVQSGIVLQVNSNPVINPVLEVGQVSEQVEVQANAAMVETRSSGIGQVIENERILELPLNGRNVVDLVTLAGAAVNTGATPDRSFGGGSFISVAGGLGYAVEYRLDGANHVNFITGAGMPMPFPDALQEFKVETSGLTAQHRDAASVGAVTKSGTNEFHGDLFEFVRNDLFNARNYFAATNSTLKRNQFGGTIGGPIVKNKLFFFGGYQGTTLREDPADLQAFVPTPAMMAGDWTAFTSPACNAGRQTNLRTPFVNNRIDPALFSRTAVNIITRLNQRPDNPCGLVIYGQRNVRNDGQAVGKVDYQWTAQHSIFGRYMATPNHNPNPATFTPDNLLNAVAQGYHSLAQSISFGDTYLISPNVVQSFRFAMNRIAVHRIADAFFSACDVGIKMSCAYTPKRMQLTVTNGFVLGGSGSPDDDRYKTNSYQINDDVSLVRGTHQMSFGVNVMHSWHYSYANFVSVGQLVVNGQETGLGLGDLMLGRLTSLFMGGPTLLDLTQNSVAIYGTDTWKMTPRLTLNYGVRWEPYFPQSMKNDVGSFSFDYDRFRQGIKSTVFRNAPAGMYYKGDAGFPDAGINNRWWQFGPRLGLAWDVNGDGRTSIRASYSMGYDFVNAQWRQDTSGAAPWAGRTLVSSPAGGLEDPWLGFPGGDPFPIKVGADTVFQPYGNFTSTPYDLKTPNTSSWNVALQRQIASAWLVSASYIGTQTAHVWSGKALNPATYFPGGPCTLNGVTYNPCSSTSNIDQRRRFSLERPADGRLMGAVAEFDSGGTISYQGMLLSVQRRAARGLTFSGNYTWSHCIGDYEPGGNGGPAATSTYTEPTNRHLDRGDCSSDRRNIFNLTAVADTPQFSSPVLRTAISGWRLSGIYRMSSGSPLTITAGTDRALNGIASQRGNQIGENPYTGLSGPLTNYLDRAAFEIPALGTMGTIGRNNIQGPRTWSFDVALSRVFRFREAQRLEFRAEAFNVTNSFRPGNPGAALNSNTFGQIRTSSEPRIMQFALKYFF
jgi:hypothetical protein